MKHFDDFKDDEAIELWAKIIDPLAEISVDKTFVSLVRDKGQKATVFEAVKSVLSEHKSALLTILDALKEDGEEITASNVVLKTTNLFVDKGFLQAFTLQGLQNTKTSGGSATENTTESGK